MSLSIQEVLRTEELPSGPCQTAHLFASLEKLLGQESSGAFRPECIGVGVGPGSYTGIRIGVAVAQALAYGWDLPLIGFSSLDGLIPEEAGLFASLVDAKMGGVYVQTGNRQGKEVERTSPPQLCSLEEAFILLEKIPLLVTSSANRLRPLWNTHFPSQSWIWKERSPCPAFLTEWVKKKYELGKWEEGLTIPPLYLRRTQAENNWEQNK